MYQLYLPKKQKKIRFTAYLVGLSFTTCDNKKISYIKACVSAQAFTIRWFTHPTMSGLTSSLFHCIFSRRALQYVWKYLQAKNVKESEVILLEWPNYCPAQRNGSSEDERCVFVYIGSVRQVPSLRSNHLRCRSRCTFSALVSVVVANIDNFKHTSWMSIARFGHLNLLRASIKSSATTGSIRYLCMLIFA